MKQKQYIISQCIWSRRNLQFMFILDLVFISAYTFIYLDILWLNEMYIVWYVIFCCSPTLVMNKYVTVDRLVMSILRKNSISICVYTFIILLLCTTFRRTVCLTWILFFVSRSLARLTWTVLQMLIHPFGCNSSAFLLHAPPNLALDSCMLHIYDDIANSPAPIPNGAFFSSAIRLIL